MTSLAEKVAEALEKVGQTFELHVARQAANAGWSIFHSHIYPDPKLKKAREIDLLLRFSLPADQDRSDERPRIRVTYVAEVKSKRGEPWVVLTSLVADQYLEKEPYFALTPYGPGMRTLMAATEAIQAFDDFAEQFPSLAHGRRIGHGIVQVFGSPREKASGPYVALRSALNACVALTASNGESVTRPRFGEPVLDVVLPLVITGDELFECYMDHTGDLVVTPVSVCRVVAPDPVRTEESLIATVVQEKAVEDFLRQAGRDAARIIELAAPAWADIVEAMTYETDDDPEEMSAG